MTVWEKTIDLQMHFNEQCLAIRRTAVTMLGVLLGAGALSFRYGGSITVFGNTTTTAFLFVAVALAVWAVFFVIDRFWYHELLRASVSYAESLEPHAERLKLPFPLDISKRIRVQNHSSLHLSGGKKLYVFYGVPAVCLGLASWALYKGLISVLG